MPPGNENSASLEGQNALRVKVAKLLGWRVLTAVSTGELEDRYYKENEPPELACQLWMLPDWTNDLNACAEFEKGLTEWQDRQYQTILVRETCCKSHRATATQRCRAFVALHEGKEK